MARRPLERERIDLDGGRRTTQLMRDSLGDTQIMPDIGANDFLSAVKPAFSFLTEERGYTLVHEAVIDSFDNGSLIYESPSLRLSVVRDRGQIFISVRARGDYRDFDPDILQLLMENADHYQSPIDASRFTAAFGAAFLRQNLAAIDNLFGPSHLEETCRRGKALMSERADQLFGTGRQS